MEESVTLCYQGIENGVAPLHHLRNSGPLICLQVAATCDLILGSVYVPVRGCGVLLRGLLLLDACYADCHKSLTQSKRSTMLLRDVCAFVNEGGQLCPSISVLYTAWIG